jgi:hypothetical protein
MREIIVHDQKQFDKLPATFKEYTRIFIQDTTERVHVTKARGNSSVVARGNSSVVAWGNSSVEARENSSVVAWGNSSVVAWGNSSVVARENSSVEARENSSVVAWENSSVEARGNVCVWGCSPWIHVAIFAFAVCYQLVKDFKLEKKSKTATVIEPKYESGTEGWLEKEGVAATRGKVILFKRVTNDFKTRKGLSSETEWKVGSTLTHPDWKPETGECGANKFHSCSRPYFCDEFMSGSDDRYIAIEISKKDLHAWPTPAYPHKIAFRKGKVLYEVDKFGRKK